MCDGTFFNTSFEWKKIPVPWVLAFQYQYQANITKLMAFIVPGQLKEKFKIFPATISQDVSSFQEYTLLLLKFIKTKIALCWSNITGWQGRCISLWTQTSNKLQAARWASNVIGNGGDDELMYSATGRPGWPYITALIAPVKIRAASQTLCGALLCIVQEIESISSWYFGFARVHICLMFSV